MPRGLLERRAGIYGRTGLRSIVVKRGSRRMVMAALLERVICMGVRVRSFGVTARAGGTRDPREEPEARDQKRRNESSSHQGLLSLAEANVHVIDPPGQTLEMP